MFQVDAQTGETVSVVVPSVSNFVGYFPEWSQDGKRIYYRLPIDGVIAFIEHDVASGREREVIRGALRAINVSPDGRWIATGKQDTSTKLWSLVLVPVGRGEPRELLRLDQGQSLGNDSMPWARDGRGVIVRKYLSANGDRSELWFVPLTNEQPRKLNVDVNHVAARYACILTGGVWHLPPVRPTTRSGCWRISCPP